MTRPGVVTAACTWDSREGMELFRTFWDAAVALDPLAESLRETNRPYGYKENLQELWNAAGFQNVEMKRLAIQMDFKSFDDFWMPYLAGVDPAGAYVATLSEDRQSALRDLLHERLFADKPEEPFTLHAHAWAVCGTVPQ